MKILFKKPGFWLTILLVFAVITTLFAQQINQLIIQPKSDYTTIFAVYDEDGNAIVNVNTSTDVLSVSGALTTTGNTTISGNLATTGTLTQTGAATFANTLDLSATLVCDTASFTGTEAADTVVIAGALITDKYLITPRGTTLDAQDNQFLVNALAGTLIVQRPASGASGLDYTWLRIK